MKQLIYWKGEINEHEHESYLVQVYAIASSVLEYWKAPSVRHVYGFVIYVMKTFNGFNVNCIGLYCIENTFCMHYLRLLTDYT